MKKIITKNEHETYKIGVKIGEQLNMGCIILLEGGIGVGKTHFVKGLAHGLDIKNRITSPTFTLLKEYEGRLNLKHIDAYRLESIDSESLGLYDLIDDKNVIAIEWSNFLDEINGDVKINIEYIDENTRQLEITHNDSFNFRYND